MLGLPMGLSITALNPILSSPKVNPTQSFPSWELGDAAGIVLKGSLKLVPSCAKLSLGASQMLKSSLEKLWLV